MYNLFIFLYNFSYILVIAWSLITINITLSVNIIFYVMYVKCYMLNLNSSFVSSFRITWICLLIYYKYSLDYIYIHIQIQINKLIDYCRKCNSKLTVHEDTYFYLFGHIVNHRNFGTLWWQLPYNRLCYCKMLRFRTHFFEQNRILKLKAYFSHIAKVFRKMTKMILGALTFFAIKPEEIVMRRRFSPFWNRER